MFPWILLGIVLVIIAAFLIFGFPHLSLPRKAGLEGIESPETVLAYDRLSRWPQFRFLRWMIVGELKKYCPNGMVVDIGCGPGYLIARMAKSIPGIEIIGVDIADSMLQVAADNLSSLGFGDRVSFRQGDVQKLPFEDNAVDFVISTFSLHHWSYPKEALLEIRRVLKPGGQFLIFDLRRDCRRFFYWLLYFATKVVVPTPMRHINEPLGSVLSSYTFSESEGILAGAGFKQWKIKPGIGWMFLWGCKSER
jgi:ubiquinone/menaquinone biosynthesis C-methylase UbiE